MIKISNYGEYEVGIKTINLSGCFGHNEGTMFDKSSPTFSKLPPEVG